MAGFNTFDLGQVYGTAEKIKSMRREEGTDALRSQYLQSQITGANQSQNLQAQQAQQEQADRTRALQQQAVAQVGGLAQQILRSGQDQNAQRQLAAQALSNPAYAQIFQAAGVDPSKIDLNSPTFDQDLQTWASLAPKQAPIAVARGSSLVDQTGQTLFSSPEDPLPRLKYEEDARHNRAMETNATQKPGSNFRVLTADEIKSMGLPAGTSAQVDEGTGKVDVINKRENLSATEQKTIREAKLRLPRLSAALRRVDRIDKALQDISKNTLANGGPVDQYALRYTDEGQELDASVAQLLPELQALTRVPGIGSQSDLESRQAALAMPSLSVNPQVNARSLAELRSFISDLKSAYDSVLTGEQLDEAPARSQQKASPADFDAQYSKIPSGATYVGPDGKTRTKR